jgi:hypothetical protein
MELEKAKKSPKTEQWRCFVELLCYSNSIYEVSSIYRPDSLLHFIIY